MLRYRQKVTALYNEQVSEIIQIQTLYVSEDLK